MEVVRLGGNPRLNLHRPFLSTMAVPRNQGSGLRPPHFSLAGASVLVGGGPSSQGAIGGTNPSHRFRAGSGLPHALEGFDHST